jgi:hypothetical protein
MMQGKCPYCGGDMDRSPKHFMLSKKQEVIFEAVVESKGEGVPCKKIMSILYPGKSEITLRTTINALNKKIKPMKLKIKNSYVILV